MQIFVFKARDAQGHLVSGKVASASMRQVQKDAEKRGLRLISLQQQARWFDNYLAYTISARDRSLFYRQLSTMLKAGVAITQAIEVTKNTQKQYLNRVIGEISLGLENGAPLSKALENYPRIFPEIELGVIRAGEATGKLEAVLKELSEEAARSASFASKVRNAMMYPLFIVIVMVIVAIVVMVKIIPSISQIFVDANVQLPLSTRILMWISHFLINDWWLLIIIVVVIAAGLRMFGVSKPGRRIWSSITINMPLVGQLLRESYLARFNRTFALLLKAGVPIIEAVGIVNKMTTNVIYQEIIGKLSKSLEQGAPITSTLQASKYFPPMMTQLLYVGQQSGDLVGMCTTLADYYEEEVDTKLKTFSAILEPAIIVVVGIGVGFIVVSVLQPIYSLSQVY